MAFRIISADHTGITVSNLERSLAFWRDVLGFELSHTAHQTGELAKEITGVAGAEIKLAVLKTPGGHKIELLEYLAPRNRKHSDVRPCYL
jgi:glyoxylase I family protein